MNLKNIENNIWKSIEINSKTIHEIIKPSSYYMIHYAFINGAFDIVKKIINLDPETIKYISKETIISIASLGKYQLILDLLNIVKAHDFAVKYILEVNNDDWILFYFLYYAPLEYVDQLIKSYDKFINWSTIINSNYPLKIFLFGHYSDKSDITFEIFNWILKHTNTKQLIKSNLSIISDGCLTGFNKNILDTIIKSNKEFINLVNSREDSPLILAIKSLNLELVNYLLDNKVNYNFMSTTSGLIQAIKLSLSNIVSQLLKYNDLDLNTFDSNKWLPAHHIFLKDNKLDHKIKLEILERTDNLNMQNINGNTPIHMMMLNDNWKQYQSIFKTKPIDLYIKSKNNKTPIDILVDKSDPNINLLLDIVSQGIVTNMGKLTIQSKKISKINKDNQTKLYNLVLKCMKTNVDKCIEQTKNNIKKLGISTIQTIEQEPDSNIKLISGLDNKMNYNLFISREVDAYIYLLYFLNKYEKKVDLIHGNPKDKDQLEIKLKDKEIKNIMEYYLTIVKTYPALTNITIFWHNKNNYICPTNLVNSIKKSKKRIIFIYVTIVNKEVDHANCLIIDKEKQRIIHFEPYGQVNRQGSIDFDTIFKAKLSDLKYDYYAPKDFLSKNSFQMLSNEHNPLEKKTGDIGGFCLAWTLWFFELYLHNLDSNLSTLVIKSTNKIINMKYSVLEYIRFYANKLRKFHIYYLKKIKYPAEKIFNIHTTNEEKNYMYLAISNSLKKYI